MDRLNQLRGEPGGSRDSTLDTSSPPSEAFMTANESSSKYYSLSEVDSTFDISPIKDVSLASATVESEKTITESDQLISNLSPIGKKSDFDNYKIGKQIEAANILSGGVDIFDDNDNSYDGDELVIDDNIEEKSNPELKLADSQFKDENSTEATLVEGDAVPSKDTEVILQIDGKNVDAIDIGNGLYLYRKEGQEELAAVQIIDDDQQQPSFKFLKVRENNEGNLEVYEEFQIEVPKEVPVKEKVVDKNVSHVPIKDISKVISDSASNKIAERKIKTQNIPKPAAPVLKELESDNKETQPECKTDSDTSKKMKFSESRKSPVIGSFKPMTFHSTPNKEGIPLTKTMVDQQLHPNRHSDNVKKTIEVHTDSVKQRILESPCKQTKELSDDKDKQSDTEKDVSDTSNVVPLIPDDKDMLKEVVNNEIQIDDANIEEDNLVIVEIDENEDEVNKLNKETQENSNKLEKIVDIPTTKNEVPSSESKEIQSPEKPETNQIDLSKKDDLVVVPKTKMSTEAEVIPKKESSKNLDTEEPVKNKDITKQAVEKVAKPSAEIELEKITDKDKPLENPKLSEPEPIKPDPIKTSPNPVVNSDTDVTKIEKVADGSVDKDKSPVESVINATNTKEPAIKDNIIKQDSIINKTMNKIEIKSDISGESKTQEVVESVSSNESESTKSQIVKNVPESLQNDDLGAAQHTENESNVGKKNTDTPEKALQTPKSDNKEDNTHNKLIQKMENNVVDKKLGNENKEEKTVIANAISKPAKETKPVVSVAAKSNKPDMSTGKTELAKIEVSEPLKHAPTVDVPKIVEKDNSIKKQDVKPVMTKQDIKQNIAQPRIDTSDKKVVPRAMASTDQKPINNNHAPVPFGKWTDVNRQAFLNKIKESKVPTNSSNGKQIKNSNDLNRRDVLKKIDSQRQAQELANMTRMGVKKETAFPSKSSAPQESKPSVKTEIPILKNNIVAAKKITKQEPETQANPQTVTTSTVAANVKKESIQRKEINNQDLIDKTIEDIINRAVPVKNAQEESSQTVTKETSNIQKSNDLPKPHADKPITQRTFDAIEMKMNELHGIPFIERPAHELPHVQKPLVKLSFPKSETQKAPPAKPSKIPNLLPFVGKVQKGVKENVIEVDSEEEVIEHEPITGDMDIIKKDIIHLPISENISRGETVTLISADSSKKETIITENDFDKFARRNSINYENCLTVNFDGNEPHHNVVQTVVQKDAPLKIYSKTETVHSESKLLSPRKHEQFAQNSISKSSVTKFGSIIDIDDCNKNYPSKVKMAYQTAMTAKRQSERIIDIIEDRPVKVVFMDSNAEYISTPLNVQGQDLSPSKKPSNELVVTQISDSVDSDTLDSIDEGKPLDEAKVKTKHQRKQVLTPVEIPELELIAPDDLGIEVSPKKKRRTEEKVEKNAKALVPKKSYLLGRGNTADDSSPKAFDLSKGSQKEVPKQEAPVVSHKNTASAIDSLVKAAELLETQASINSTSSDAPPTPDSQQNTPIKRGRGRPRKYPLPDGATDKTVVPSPQKKPRLIDAKVVKNKDSDNDDDSSDDELLKKENWTMGKINENIVCPICNKLFRSENVVFKHVKHCTGPSPSRSDSDNKSPRRLRDSQESETKSFDSKSDDMDIDETITPHKDVRKKRKSKDTLSKISNEKDEVIVIEDTPIKPKVDRRDERAEYRKTINKNKVPDKVTSLVCEFCGKTFRQLSYLVSHKLQHGKEDIKKHEEDLSKTTKSVFSCETCKKEFRKLHHLVQHRIIHNPSSMTGKMSRKSSSEQSDHKSSKDQNSAKQSDDLSAGFRCEPCDKSFRKLHHLVEHRETHDGINRQKITTTSQPNADKLPPPPQCDVCKKTFRKLHHLIEHKEQHLETSSEKSDDKSIKSSLSTKDIIHECSLCYMVFPNEHSLNKHTIICLRKKRQSATKQLKPTEGVEKTEEDKEITKPDESNLEKDDDVTIVEEFPAEQKSEQQEKVKETVEVKVEEKIPAEDKASKPEKPIPVQRKESSKSVDAIEKPEIKKVIEIVEPKPKVVEDLPIKAKKIEEKESKPKVQETPKKKTPLKEKVAPIVTKRHKPNIPVPVVDDVKPAESSDDDEIRYMLNPDYKFEENEGKLFMKVRANKRNSLQIERPNSKDLVKRRISLQHPPKVPRLKPKPIPSKPLSSTATTVKTVVKPKLEPVPSTDSDDSDVKYSFPESTSENVSKPLKNVPEVSSKDSVKKAQRKSLAEKRKSLSSIAKRKSLGKAVGVKHKVKASPMKQVRKRAAPEHRCDCGQLFGSAALLARHHTLAHTPPRIRRRRDPEPEPAKPAAKPAPKKSILPPKTNPGADSRKSTAKTDDPAPTQPSTKRKSIKTEPKTPTDSRRSLKTSDRTESAKSAPSDVKLRRYAAHKGVPVPEKMRKLMEKSKK